jgi:adenylate cyclase
MEAEFFGEKTITVEAGQTILEASLNAGIPHFHACGGKAKCSTCRILILEGEQHLSKPNQLEEKIRALVKLPATVRLACQVTVETGSVKVDRMIKDWSEASAFLKLDEHRPGHFELRPLGEEKQLVLFFLDIRNFTPFVEKHLPFDVIYLIRKLFDIFYAAIVNKQGQVIETTGDEMYAVFGQATSLKKAADSAIAAGFDILEQLRSLNNAYAQILSPGFEVGIGLHSGKVIIGEINLGGYIKKNVMGLAVNIAARIQQSTKQLNNSFIVSGEIIRQSTYNGISEEREVMLAGIGNPIHVHLIGKPYEDRHSGNERPV